MKDGADPLVTWEGPLSSVWPFEFAMETMVMQHPNVTEWFLNNSALCSIIKSASWLTKPAGDLTNSLGKLAAVAADAGRQLLVPLRFALPFGLLIFQVVWWSLASWRFVKELNDFAQMLLNLPGEVKRETMRPIRKDSKVNVDEGHAIPATSSFSLPLVFNSIIIFLFAAVAGLQIGQTFNLEAYNNDFWYLNTWSMNARSRSSYIMESSVFTWLSILSYNSMTHRTPRALDYIDAEAVREAAKVQAQKYTVMNHHLLEDDGNTPISVGVDPYIDRLTLEEKCTQNASGTSFHQMYQCGSLLQIMQVHHDMITQAYISPQDFNGVLEDGSLSELIHIVDRHIMPVLLDIDDEYGLLTDKFITKFKEMHVIFFVLELVLNVVIALVSAIYVYTLHSCYVLLLRLMRRVSPVHILGSEDLEAYLLGVGMSTHERIINISQNCIICMGATGVIEMVNPAVSKTFGYTSEQALSLPFTTLMNGDSADKISQQMNLMANHQSSAVFEGHTVCTAEDQSEIPCSISIMASFVDGKITQFVAILKDESTLMQRQQAAAAAKQQSENLLYQILPRSIVTRINTGEKDISFTVPSATIMFIDIVKFSQYAWNLTPQDIMGNLSMIFAGFDQEITKYSMLLKIKLIGDVYMCAGGLFDAEKPPAIHAEQMIHFALDALRVIDEMNERLNAALAVRIGVNSGGPLLAGVLGTDKPTFDIIGDPINIAARLQSTDVPGSIQISEATRDLIADLDFNITPRGKVFLKGKGERQTFLIEPTKELGGFQAISQPNLQDFGIY
jgi:guanylate cyclase